jgi:hypothetical protein
MSVNIGESNAGDAFYRYKMPKLQSRVRSPPLSSPLVYPSMAWRTDHKSADVIQNVAINAAIDTFSSEPNINLEGLSVRAL